jgi:DNA polymerase III subunit epsilon
MKLPGWVARGPEHDSTPVDKARYIVFDTELTSLDKRSNRMLSIGAIAMDGPGIRLQDQFYRVVNPGVTAPTEAILIHGLRPSDVATGEPPGRVLQEFRGFIGDSVLVGHFTGIDKSIVEKELGGAKLPNPAICTARVERWLLSRQPCTDEILRRMEHLDLATLAASYGLEVHAAHHALEDAFLTARLWQRQIYALAAANLKSLDRLLRIARV